MARIARGLGAETIVEGSNEVYVDPDGTPRQGVMIAGSPELIEEYRSGYRCLRCHGAQSEPFPEVCEVRDIRGGDWRCGFRIRDNQLRYLEAEFRGSHRYGPTPDHLLEDEREREAWTKRSGIWVPGAS